MTPEQFVVAHTAISRAPLVPEVALHLASEITPIWQATESWLAEQNIEPPFWAFAWPGGQALARYLLDNPEAVRGQSVFVFAAGSGIDAIAAAVVVAMAACYGIFRMSLEAGRASVRLRTMLVQINIPQDAARPLWDPVDVHVAYEEETLRAFDELGKEDRQGGQATSKRPDWVMWPESALTGRILRAGDGAWATWRENEDTIARVRAAGDFQLLHGVNEIEAVDDGADGLEMKEGARVCTVSARQPRRGSRTSRRSRP